MSKLPVKQLRTGAKEMDLGDAKVFHLPDWNKLSHPQRLAVLRQIAMMRARDPRIAKLAVSIFKASGVQPRKYDQQAAALLQWVQNPKNCYYVNEAGERLQDPIHTIKIGHGDCFAENTLVLRDDMEYVKIQDVQVGSRIWGRDKWSTVVNFWDKGPLAVTEVELNNGSTLRLTEGHKVYVRSCPLHGPTCKDLIGKCRNCKDRDFEWVRLHVSELVEGMVVLQPDRITPESSASWDADTSWMMGAYIAEGWSEDCRISISGKDGHWKEQTKHRAKAIAERKGWATRWHAKYLAINSKEAVAWAEGCGHGALNKQIPVEALRDADADALDIGLRLDASQNSRGEGWTFGTISERLALQYRTLQRVLGRSTSATKVVEHGGFGTNPIFRVGVRNPTKNNDRKLKIAAIRREVETVPCYDIATDDHYVYLPEADCTVSNCDDQVLLLTCLFESVGLPWKLVLSGVGPNGKTRYVEGESVPPGVKWTHIYCMVGTPAFNPTTWYFCETTIQGVPLGWDVISGDHSYLPEMGGKKGDAVRVVTPNPAPNHYRPAPLPPKGKQSPAYAMAYSGAFPEAYGSAYGSAEASALAPASLVGTTVGSYMAEEAVARDESSSSGLDWRKWGTAIATGVLVSVGTQLTLDYLRGTGSWTGKGAALARWKAWATPSESKDLI